MSVERGAILHTAGLRTHVLKAGPGRNMQQGGPPTLLLHGLGSLAQEILAPLRDAAPGRFFVAPDRPGYGLSDPLDINPGPIGQAHWLRFVVDAIGGGPPVIVAHSIAAGVALAFAALYPERLRGLVLIAPFCRPTRHALMLGLRLATLPVIGPLLQKTVIPHLAATVGRRKFRRAFAPKPPPRSLTNFPFTQAAKPGAATTISGELLAFNRDMALCRRKFPTVAAPVHVLCAPNDSILDIAWHVGWLCAWKPDCVVHFLRAGHLIHHAQPQAILIAIRMLETQLGAARAA